MASIGSGWRDGSWVTAGWVAAAWSGVTSETAIGDGWVAGAWLTAGWITATAPGGAWAVAAVAAGGDWYPRIRRRRR